MRPEHGVVYLDVYVILQRPVDLSGEHVLLLSVCICIPYTTPACTGGMVENFCQMYSKPLLMQAAETSDANQYAFHVLVIYTRPTYAVHALWASGAVL